MTWRVGARFPCDPIRCLAGRRRSSGQEGVSTVELRLRQAEFRIGAVGGCDPNTRLDMLKHSLLKEPHNFLRLLLATHLGVVWLGHLFKHAMSGGLPLFCQFPGLQPTLGGR